jgi:hypothetical protein
MRGIGKLPPVKNARLRCPFFVPQAVRNPAAKQESIQSALVTFQHEMGSAFRNDIADHFIERASAVMGYCNLQVASLRLTAVPDHIRCRHVDLGEAKSMSPSIR